jgi:hypothetical protein
MYVLPSIILQHSLYGPRVHDSSNEHVSHTYDQCSKTVAMNICATCMNNVQRQLH